MCFPGYTWLPPKLHQNFLRNYFQCSCNLYSCWCWHFTISSLCVTTSFVDIAHTNKCFDSNYKLNSLLVTHKSYYTSLKHVFHLKIWEFFPHKFVVCGCFHASQMAIWIMGALVGSDIPPPPTKGPGTRHTHPLPIQETWYQWYPPSSQTEWQTPVKTSPSFIGGR